MTSSPPLILASGSASRAALLTAAGVAFETLPARIDEAAVKQSLLAEGAPVRDIAATLAELKARRGASRLPGRLVLGADQVLVCEGRLFDKPESAAEAADHLRALRGKTHQLLAAAVICENGEPIWRHVGQARLTMRPFTDGFLDEYISLEGDALLSTVGAYRLEGLGAQLFQRVEGDYFSILGLPLLELLGFLRARRICIE